MIRNQHSPWSSVFCIALVAGKLHLGWRVSQLPTEEISCRLLTPEEDVVSSETTTAMAKRQRATIPLIFGLLISNLVCTLGRLECEDLPIEDCAFSVASTGTRCVLEKYQGKDNSIRYECQSSIIIAEKQEEWIESDECIKACGLERMSVGLSTDLLMDNHFAEMFCSSECLNNCPNIIDLYISLAAGEGMYLPQLCKVHRTRRVIADPVKKAMDAEYLRSLLPQLTSAGAMAPEGSPNPESGGIPSGLLPKGPDYRGYGGSSGDVARSSGGEAAPPPVAGSDTPVPFEKSAAAMGPSSSPAPVARPSASSRPFFSSSSSSPQSASASETADSGSGSDSGISPSPSPSPSSVVTSESSAPAPSEASWPQELSVNSLPELNDEESLYETYFNKLG